MKKDIILLGALVVLVAFVSGISGFIFKKHQLQERQGGDVRMVSPEIPSQETKPPAITKTQPTEIPSTPTVVEVNPENTWNGETVITSPQGAEIFYLGESMHIKWNPELVDVSTIQLVPRETALRDIAGFQVYSRQSLADNASQTGEIYYTIPNDLLVYPGIYRVRVLSYGAKDSYISNSFTIESKVPLRKKLDEPFRITGVIGAQDSYKKGQTIKLNIETMNGDGTSADSQKSFMVAGLLFNKDNQGIYSGTGTYEPNAQVWHLEVPVTDINAYRLQIQLYCGSVRITSICAQEHPSGTGDSKFITFSVTE